MCSNADGFIAREEFASLYDINVGKPRAMSTTLDAIEEKLVEKFGSLEGAFGAFDTLSPHGRLTANEFIIGMLNIRDPTFGMLHSLFFFRCLFSGVNRSEKIIKKRSTDNLRKNVDRESQEVREAVQDDRSQSHGTDHT